MEKFEKRKRWKGKWISGKMFNLHMKQVDTDKKRKRVPEEEKNTGNSKKRCVEGRRIVDLEVMRKNMYCHSCQNSLTLETLEDEIPKGLASLLRIRCSKCFLINEVPTDTTHTTQGSKALIYDVNTRAALGAIHAGLGHRHVEKFMSILDIPMTSCTTFKVHEREIGKAIESVAEQSCHKAAQLERNLTIEDSENLGKLLPEEYGENFILPDRKKERNENESSGSAEETVRIFGAGDMGYNYRVTGFIYDSLNGYAGLIGFKSKKGISYVTENRGCRKCSVGSKKWEHDCRQNFYGSAKAMEANAAVRLVTQNPILKDLNLEVGVFIGDNDASSISAIKGAASHPVIKFADGNHTSKGVKNMLWKISKNEDPDHQLTPDAIKYFQRCFNYAVKQNIGNTIGLEAAIKNIPYHAFNHHENCGSWCGFLKDPINYKHRVIPGGFTSQKLFDKLTEAFDKLSKNSQQFSAGGSIQGNESLNAIMARKAPKANCYSLSESADFRFAAAVCQKNEGSTYVLDVLKKIGLNEGKNLVTVVEKEENLRKNRIEKAQSKEFKQHRRELTKQRSQLRFRREANEEDTYRSDMGLLVEKKPSTEVPEQFLGFSHECDLSSLPLEIIFFDLETAGFSKTADVLQISMKSEDSIFNQYIKPKQSIPTQATDVHRLSSVEGQLYHNGHPVQSSPVNLVLKDLLIFLKGCAYKNAKKCLLVAHNCSFDAPRLIRIIKEASMMNDFEEIISGFSDTLPLFKQKFPYNKEAGTLTLVGLAQNTLSQITDGAHDALFDVCLLERLVFKHLNLKNLIETSKKFNAGNTLSSLDPLKNILSRPIRQRLANADISLEKLQSIFTNDGEEKVLEVLKQTKDGKATLIKLKRHLDAIIEFLSSE